MTERTTDFDLRKNLQSAWDRPDDWDVQGLLNDLIDRLEAASDPISLAAGEALDRLSNRVAAIPSDGKNCFKMTRAYRRWNEK